MNTRSEKDSLKRIARITGALILIITVIAPFSMLYIPSTLVVPGDAAATASNVAASEGTFRLAIASDALVFLIEIVLVVLLYVLLKPLDNTLALIAAFARLAMTVVQGVNLLTYFTTLLLASGADYLTVFEPGQLDALVFLFLNLHEQIALIWGLFFSLHLLILGYLVYKSGYIPRLVGILLLVASLSYLIQGFGSILLPGYEETFATIGFLSMVELALPLWLVIKGVKDRPQDKGAPAPA
jgi:hypothetical protein